MTAPTIDKTQIETALDRLETLAASSSPENAPFFAKMAILELSGWVEETIDDFVLNLALPHLRDENAHRRFEEIVRQNRGFTYESHFWRLLGLATGIVNLEQTEENMDERVLSEFKTALNGLSEIRNRLAHTSLEGTQQRTDTPTQTKLRLQTIHAGLESYAAAITPRAGSTPRAESTPRTESTPSAGSAP